MRILIKPPLVFAGSSSSRGVYDENLPSLGLSSASATEGLTDDASLIKIRARSSSAPSFPPRHGAKAFASANTGQVMLLLGRHQCKLLRHFINRLSCGESLEMLLDTFANL
ncbi:hypothetical protein HGRIS_002934 [Hohenbuehelia grisea]|uniref:Uncharacterized protein n=1 Tax=Hohenbuehelia grisea TaxID=104357 RepID=A0ABR3JLZ1_9AGAR